MKTLQSLYALAKYHKIPVEIFDLPQTESLAIMDEKGNCFIGIDKQSISSEQEELIRIAHELGHCETGAFYNRYSALDIRQKHENRAKHWAYQTLLPAKNIEQAIKQGYVEPWQIAEYTDLPEAFVRDAIVYYRSTNQLKENFSDINYND